MKRGAFFFAASAAVVAVAAPSWAGTMPEAGGVDLVAPATRVMQDIVAFHNFLLPIIVGISVFVLALLLWVIIRFNRAANPNPRKFTHNMTIEVIWTLVPVLILVAIAARSFPLLYEEERVPPAELTLKVTGNSWFWTYEYPDLGVQITSNMMPEDEARASGRPALLATTEPLVVPIDTTVRVLITSNDVIHSWAVPSFGFKQDAIQGRVNQGWFRVDSDLVDVGTTVYGQCSELCGLNHSYMPIEIRAVSRPEFDQWVAANGGSVAAPATAEPQLAPTDAASPAARADAPAR